MGRLDGKVAIVTGAGRGIGAATARLMAAEGASVVVCDLGVSVAGTGQDQGPAAGVVEEISQAGGKAVTSFGNVADYDAAEGIIKTALDNFERLDVLVNVAGILRDRMVFNMSEEEWDAVIKVHLYGTFFMTKHASVWWRQNQGGQFRLINFTSVSGLHGAPGQPNYAAAKMGIVGFTFSCANALGKYGVTSNCISPFARTRMVATVDGQEAPKEGDQGTAENVAPAAVYLASERSHWLNGRIIGSAGGKISLYNVPEEIGEIKTDGPWNVDDVFRRMEEEIRPLLGEQQPAAAS